MSGSNRVRCFAVSLAVTASLLVLHRGLIAAEQTGRRAFLMEIDRPYCDVIVQRWEKFTGKSAERTSVS